MHPFNFLSDTNGYCTKNCKHLPPGALQVEVVMLYRGSCSCTVYHKHAIQPSAEDITDYSGGGGHQRAQKIITLYRES